MRKKETGNSTVVTGVGESAAVIRRKAEGVDDDARAMLAEAVAHNVMLLLRIRKYEEAYGVLIVSANNQAAHVDLKPLLHCPKMIYKKACKVCIWNDRAKKECRGG